MAHQISDFLNGDFSKSVYVQRARDLVPELRKRSEKQWHHPRVLDETIADMQEAGFFQMLQPRRWGGGETTPIESFEVASILSEGEPSVGWVLGVVGIHAYHLAFFSERAQEEVWGRNTKTLISSPYAPGKAVRVDGGYRLSGRWSFSSGSDHCDWTFLGGNVEGEEHGSTAKMSGLPAFTFLLPRSDYEVVHNWNVHGLRSTGSNDLIVKDVFIPEHRALLWEQVLTNSAPGQHKNNGLLYKLPFFQIFSRATQPPAALGALKGMVQSFIDFNAGKVSRHGVHIGQNPQATLVVAESLSRVEEMKSQVYKNYARVIAEVEGGTSVPMDDRRQFRFQASQIGPRCAKYANELYRITGGNAIYEDQAFGRFLNDLMAIQTHQLCNYQLHANAWAGTLLGYEEAARNYHA
ncbi:MAG TPA: acyl-CoA dehydrogenase [Hydrogenophaga sp.]|uniref:acyl-CoA dehydrogenase family protein n=1 Tax=Hydrogenophaga sp. TaxID=1904254 RepID=UPI0008D42A2E|nr:acyl-CoA dehydrogenase family protein [Hydrogenophaga sp.]OGA76110.1 MAG: acyl-CoA dehydrogenase [Burkholderiales bacterium GWE1_65_30]OGA91076.1 MAG: acyl-CoA dehydrogenase [Burkholderiales bacterium GWF1_66_17]HAX23314.1 acyl-CoA dehydrogenase [Hydrogenophaga sp.]HBU19200.1 acyl-CoA dehydrogenase [Hydrogenophaga sp.]